MFVRLQIAIVSMMCPMCLSLQMAMRFYSV